MKTTYVVTSTIPAIARRKDMRYIIRRELGLSSTIQSRLKTLCERHEQILRELQSSGHSAQGIGKELSSLSSVVSLIKEKTALDEEEKSLIELMNDAIRTKDTELEYECKGEIETITCQRTQLEKRIVDAVLPKDEDDFGSNAIIEIRAGTGGEEATLFADEILNCYIKTAKELQWKVEELSVSRSDLGGVKEASVAISGGATYEENKDSDDSSSDSDQSSFLGPYGVFKFESGVHRVQRIPINDTKLQTSACSVAVLPLAIDNSNQNTDLLPMSELRIETMRASGAGGQHINTTDSAVRITHIPTGITASIQDGRSQHKNKEQALQLISARVRDMKREENARKLGETRSALMGGGDRSERIRTYNYPQDRITDHRCKESRHGIDILLSGSNPRNGIVLSFLPYLKAIHRQELLEKLEENELSKEKDRKLR